MTIVDLIFLAGVLASAIALIAAAFLRPQRIRPADEPWCFDDWCLRVERVDSAPAGANVRYAIKLRIYSTARRRTQRASGAWIYLFDDRHLLYAPNPDKAATPLDVELAPLASVETSRVAESVVAGGGFIGIMGICADTLAPLLLRPTSDRHRSRTMPVTVS